MGRPPKLSQLPNRIRTLRLQRGMSLRNLAEHVGSNASSVARFETGEARLNLDMARRVAKALAVEPEELLPKQTVPIVGLAGAGGEVRPFEDAGERSRVECPRGLDPAHTVAVEVRGESQAPIADGWLIFYDNRAADDPGTVLGKLCVVQLADDDPVPRTLLKVVRRGPGPGRFNLLSTNAPLIEDVALAWAKPVRAILPPDLVRAGADQEIAR